MGLLYYLPGLNSRPTPEQIRAAGLGYALDGCAVSAVGVTGGPDGGSGQLLTRDDPQRPALVGYYPAKQTWRKVAQSPIPNPQSPIPNHPWIGLTTAEPPGPDDLQRRDALAGHTVRLGDGRLWTVPIARAHAEDDASVWRWYQRLPETCELDEQGQWVRGQVVARYRELWDLAAAWWEAFLMGGQRDETAEGTVMRFDFAGSADAAVRILACNYRIGRMEAAMLGLLDERSVSEILGAVIDWPTRQAWLKKKADSAGSSTVDGPMAATAATGQA
ncbi:MAG: hypothetical protein IMZ55_00665 [Acidobacteria bacterium]|nr:hypothetical protein [Acidobacteriota bacterium]